MRDLTKTVQNFHRLRVEAALANQTDKPVGFAMMKDVEAAALVCWLAERVAALEGEVMELKSGKPVEPVEIE